ncbi:S8 family peptidase [Bacteroidota bacterium]
MRISKTFYISGLVMASLVSCKSVHRIAVPAAVSNAIELPSKKVELTENQKHTWGHADIVNDTIPGMSVAKAYEFLKGKKSTEIIVSVNDSGIDLQHEDLVNVLWSNPKEIADNGKDDDKNGYIDDVHGWNFLGEIYDENLELTRIIKEKSKKFEGKTENQISEKDKAEYDEYMKLKEIFDKKLGEASELKNKYSFYYGIYESAHKAMVAQTGKEDYTLEDVEAIVTTDENLIKQKEMTARMLKNGTSNVAQMQQVQKGLDHFTSQVDTNLNLDFNAREVLNDDENDFTTKVYGNGNPMNRQADEIHGTHVAGIILAENGNGKGVDGVATNVKLMSVRCVPNGDEYDKDVALGLIYAVDNGAKVINTSFGKGYSPNSKWVHDAIKYAEKHDVLIVNAAGNDAVNIDVEATFPNDDAPDMIHEIADNMLTVGAMGSSYDKHMLATFSNYGKKNVDVFAPGVKIYATVPNGKYQYLSGTSMASPSTAGVAAMIRSYYPKLSAKQVKYILMNSGVEINFKLIKPGTKDEMVSLSDLCVSGRIVNAYNAVKMADEMVSKK